MRKEKKFNINNKNEDDVQKMSFGMLKIEEE